jgi:hypothetical protein
MRLIRQNRFVLLLLAMAFVVAYLIHGALHSQIKSMLSQAPANRSDWPSDSVASSDPDTPVLETTQVSPALTLQAPASTTPWSWKAASMLALMALVTLLAFVIPSKRPPPAEESPMVRAQVPPTRRVVAPPDPRAEA